MLPLQTQLPAPVGVDLQPLPQNLRLARLAKVKSLPVVRLARPVVSVRHSLLTRALTKIAPLAFTKAHPWIALSTVLVSGLMVTDFPEAVWEKMQEWLDQWHELESLKIQYKQLVAFLGYEMPQLKYQVGAAQQAMGAEILAYPGNGFAMDDADGPSSVQGKENPDKNFKPGERVLYQRPLTAEGAEGEMLKEWGTVLGVSSEGYVRVRKDNFDDTFTYSPELLTTHTPIQEARVRAGELLDQVQALVAEGKTHEALLVAKAALKWSDEHNNDLVVVEIMRQFVVQTRQTYMAQVLARGLLASARTLRHQGQPEQAVPHYEAVLARPESMRTFLVQCLVTIEFIEVLGGLDHVAGASERRRVLIDHFSQHMLPKLMPRNRVSMPAQQQEDPVSQKESVEVVDTGSPLDNLFIHGLSRDVLEAEREAARTQLSHEMGPKATARLQRKLNQLPPLRKPEDQNPAAKIVALPFVSDAPSPTVTQPDPASDDLAPVSSILSPLDDSVLAKVIEMDGRLRDTWGDARVDQAIANQTPLSVKDLPGWQRYHIQEMGLYRAKQAAEQVGIAWLNLVDNDKAD